MLRLVLTVLTAALLPMSRGQPDGPTEPLNPNPTDTSNPRLVGKAFPFNQLPYQVDTSGGARGPQAGYNRCNDTTLGPNSMCQTLIVNDLSDFCIYAPQKMADIGNAEGEVVTWCTKPTHGSRVIPPGTITGAQFIKTPSYIEFTGTFDQTKVNIVAGDAGGELDSGGADDRGNPIGGVAYSINMPSGKAGTLTQSRMWHLFIGGNTFCMKFCDETAPNASGICRHTYDTIGCGPNVPAAYRNNVFEACEGEDQGPVTPNNFAIPASSNCKTFASTELWPVSSSTTAAPTATATSGSGTTSGSGSGATSTPGNGASSRSHLEPLATMAIILLALGAANA